MEKGKDYAPLWCKSHHEAVFFLSGFLGKLAIDVGPHDHSFNSCTVTPLHSINQSIKHRSLHPTYYDDGRPAQIEACVVRKSKGGDANLKAAKQKGKPGRL